MLRCSVVFLAAVLLAAAAPAWGQQKTVVDRIVAVVNTDIITAYELEDRLKPVLDQLKGRKLSPQEERQVADLRRQTLNTMIDEMLIDYEVKRFKIEVSDPEVQAEITNMLEERKMTEEEFDKQLKLRRMTRKEFHEKMRRDILKHRVLGHFVGNKVVITDSEVEKEFKARQGNYVKGKFVHLRMMLVPPGELAAKLKKQIEAKEITFAEAADKHSIGPGAGQGGDIGTLAWKDMAPEWREALAGLAKGQISQPFRVQEYEAVLLLEDVQEGEAQNFAEVKDQIYQALHQAKFEKIFTEYLQQLRSKAVIEIKE